eukprot:1617961-Prymnesium_polylepis.1
MAGHSAFARFAHGRFRKSPMARTGKNWGVTAQPLTPQLSKPQQVGTVTVWQCKQQLTSTNSIAWAASLTGPPSTQRIRRSNNAASLATYATE